MEFIAVRQASHALPGHQQQLLANVLAQPQALMQGKPDPGGHRDFPGNRPCTFLLLERLDPAGLGALLALYEHRVFVSGPARRLPLGLSHGRACAYHGGGRFARHEEQEKWKIFKKRSGPA